MSMSDPIADLLTRIRNAQMVEKPTVVMPSSKLKVAIAKVLQEEGYIEGFAVRGTGGLAGGRLETHGDHRLALLGAVAGLASTDGVEVVDMEAASVSYPGFADDLATLMA